MYWVSWMKQQNKTLLLWMKAPDEQGKREWKPKRSNCHQKEGFQHSVISCCAGQFPRGLCSIPVGLPLDDTSHKNKAFIFRYHSMKEFLHFFLPCFLFGCILKCLFYLFDRLMVGDFQVDVTNRPAALLIWRVQEDFGWQAFGMLSSSLAMPIPVTHTGAGIFAKVHPVSLLVLFWLAMQLSE